jgi:N-acetylglucosaminyl-diphospho-decaprenol L-rhamnosyltransferase
MPDTSNSIVISIISHKQGHLVRHLLQDVQHFCFDRDPEVILTVNVTEEIPFKEEDFEIRVRVVRNECPKGFGANHNQAFQMSSSDFFCIMNPDVRLIQDPFQLLSPLVANRRIGVIAPLILNSNHQVEDSARKLPTPFRLIKRVLGPKENNLDYSRIDKPLFPDWLAGIFMVFPRNVFSNLKGFDERYFLYFEDVDLCSRLRLTGYKVVLEPSVTVIHEARRDSHRQLRYFYWHTVSGIRFFSSPVFWRSFFQK